MLADVAEPVVDTAAMNEVVVGVAVVVVTVVVVTVVVGMATDR